MFHYYVRVSSSEDSMVSRDTIGDRIEYFNGRRQYLLYDGGDSAEQRYILVSEDKRTKDIEKELKDIFESPVVMEAINAKSIDRTVLKKIQTSKTLMINDNYCGEQRIVIVTDSIEEITDRVNKMVGFIGFKEFFADFSGLIDRTTEMTAKCLYNIALINKCGICLENHIKFLYELISKKGLLHEPVIVTGDVYDAKQSKKETRFLYHIAGDWDISDYGESFSASDEVQLLNKIRRSNNVYITVLSQEQYDKLSTLDCFNAAFPNAVIIDELTNEEKYEYICSIADEYSFSVNRDVFYADKALVKLSVNEIESAIRKAIMRKLAINDVSFCIERSDLNFKPKKVKKLSAFDELESMIGLGSVKQTIKEITSFLEKRGKNAVPCLHKCFKGSPGTGKTSVARLLARIYYETGITKKNLLVETDREGLCGAYIGQTAIKTKRIIESAMGGVLFIDEAYSLFTGDTDSIDYGHEAVSTLVKMMEDRRDDFVCILAGYTEEMEKMINMNTGLRDRVQFYIDFPDYNESELMQIFEMFCKENKYRISKSAKDALADGFSHIMKSKSENFSNGRLVRKLFERARMKQAMRTSSNTITGEDIKTVFAEKDIATLFDKSNRSQIGFNV